jgi:alpha-tubulin suppressor-like RCC1 family protein
VNLDFDRGLFMRVKWSRLWGWSNILVLILSVLLPASHAQASNLKVQQVSTGFGHTCVLDQTGDVYCWGNNEVGQIGIGSTQSPIAEARKLSQFTNARMVSAGGAHNCVIDRNQDLYCWGQNGNGKIGSGNQEQANSPLKVSDISQVSYVHASRLATCAISKGEVFCFGSNQVAELQTESKEAFVLTPSRIPGITGASKVLVGTQAACALVESGSLYCWGIQLNGRLGTGLEENKSHSPILIKLPGEISDFGVGAGHICSISKSNGDLICWGWGEKGQLGNGSNPLTVAIPTKVEGLPPVKSVVLNRFSSCAVDVSNRVYCWGGGEFSQNGNPERKDTNIPKLIDGLGPTKSLSMASSFTSHMCAIETAGDTKCWGYGFSLQLGNSVPGDLAKPVKIFEKASVASDTTKPTMVGNRDLVIQCKKGNQVKQVVGTAPKCPSGFKEALIKKPRSVFYLDMKKGCYSANFPVTSLVAPQGRQDYKTHYESDCSTPYHFQVIYSGKVKTTNNSPLPTQDEMQAFCTNQYKLVMGKDSPKVAIPGGIFLSWYFPDAGFEASKYPQKGVCFIWKWDTKQTYGPAPYAMSVASPLAKKG